MNLLKKVDNLFEAALSDWANYVNKSPMLKAAVGILNQLNAKGKAYIVGGAVRDIITGEKEPDDIDIATNVPMEEVAKMFDTYDLGQSKTFGVLGIKHMGHTFEVAQFRSDGAYLDGRRPEKVQVGVDFKTDVERRDFTINAMGVDAQGNVIDYYNGQSDIKNKVLRTVGDPHKRFGEDYLRMLRAARFASRMGYNIDPETKQAMSAHAEKIKQIAPERILKEIVKMAEQTGDRFAGALQILKDTGLLQHILPEVMEMDKYEHAPETHPEGNVLQHTIEALKQNQIKDPIINLAILLHDIGKIKTFKKEGDKVSFIGHAEEGVDLINQIADRLHMDNKTREALIYAAVNHMKFHEILDMSTNKIVNLIDNDNWNVLYATAFADAAARKGLFDKEEWNKITAKIEQISKEYQGKKSIANIKKVIDGNWVMQLKGLPQGPEVGKVISATVTWILDNGIDINDTEKIKQYILSL
jgi:poly(A) polymerase